MSEEKPLHVRVAEALGWRDCKLCDEPMYHNGGVPHWVGDAPIWANGRPGIIRESHCMPPYGEDSPAGWACTGPLVSKYGIELRSYPREWQAWINYGGSEPSYAAGATAPDAIANLIITLAAAGKLER